MSSRLLTMKARHSFPKYVRLLTMSQFMQRAAASPSAPSTPSNANGPPSKRVRLSNGTASPATPYAQQEAVQAALAAEEAKRLQALERHAADSGETRWVFSVQEQPRPQQSLNVVTAGFGDIDSLDDDEIPSQNVDDEENAAPTTTGRRIFGNLKRPTATSKDEESSHDSSSHSSAGSSDASDEDDDPTARFIRETRKDAAAQARRENGSKRRASTPQESQASTQVNLASLKSISGRSAPPSSDRSKKAKRKSSGRHYSPSPDHYSRPRVEKSPKACFRCGQPGHMFKDCPNG